MIINIASAGFLLLVASSLAHGFTPAVNDVPWRVVEIDGKPVEDAGTLVFFRNQVGGKAACNRIFGQFAPTPNKGHAFTGIGTTRMHCEGKMEREQLLLKALERMQAHKLDGLVLTLLDAEGKPLVKLQQ